MTFWSPRDDTTEVQTKYGFPSDVSDAEADLGFTRITFVPLGEEDLRRSDLGVLHGGPGEPLPPVAGVLLDVGAPVVVLKYQNKTGVRYTFLDRRTKIPVNVKHRDDGRTLGTVSDVQRAKRVLDGLLTGEWLVYPEGSGDPDGAN